MKLGFTNSCFMPSICNKKVRLTINVLRMNEYNQNFTRASEKSSLAAKLSLFHLLPSFMLD